MNTMFGSPLWRKFRLVILLVVAFSAAFSPAMPTLGRQSTDQPTNLPAPQTDPIVIVDKTVNTYSITNGLLYYGNFCWQDFEFRWDGYLERMPSHGGAYRVLQTTTTADCATFWYMAADETGVYYIDLDEDQLEFRSAGNPSDPVVLYTGPVSINMTILALDETYIYWGDTLLNRVMRLPKTGGTPTIFRSTGAGLSGVVLWLGSVFWMDNSGLWKCNDANCTAPTRESTVTGLYLRSTQWGIYWVTQANPQEIYLYTCFIGCAAISVYTAQPNWTIYNTALGLCADLSSSCLFWTESLNTSLTASLRRMIWGGGSAETIADNLHKAVQVETDDQGVYFTHTSQYLYRLPFTAEPIARDIQAAAWEVTQVNQSLDNDVPMVANKPTYVRLYPALTGEHANFVNAHLVGTRLGVPLPGSPLAPLDGNMPLDESWSFNRSDASSGYLFQLPDSWTDPGTITLQAVVDPQGVYADDNPANNSLSKTFTFGYKPPVCDIFIPVRTNTPAASVGTAHFWDMIDLQRRLWPVPDVWAYHQDDDVTEPEFCWKWGFIPWVCDGPYELDEDSSWEDWVADDGEALLHIGTRALFSDDPDECDDIGSAVHYVGMVHYNAPHAWDGLAYIYDWMAPASWVVLPNPNSLPTDDFSWPAEGDVLAHEASHNHEREHVDCPVGAPDDPGYYPYPVCQIDDDTDPTHFGFDVNTRHPISPTQAADYMSYNWDLWASDFTYKAMYGRFPTLETTTAPELAAAAEAVLISANVNPELDSATLHYAWVYPTSGMSQNILGKWSELIAQPFVESTANPNAVNYHLRLLDSGDTTLADITLDPLPVEVHSGETRDLSFQQTFAAPAGVVARMELLADEVVLISREPGMASPEVEIVLPAGGEVFTDSMTISWQASDPDEDVLLFNVQYSPDGGLTWRSIAENTLGVIEGESNLIELDDLAGLGASVGATGMIRVAASDGYHTTLAVSAAFTVADQLPEVYIISPEATQIYPPGESIALRGGAMDPETGGLSGTQLDWTVGVRSYGSGAESRVDGLAPGTYNVKLEATDPAGHKASQGTTMIIGRLEIPQGSSTPTLDGSCEDVSYGDQVLRLKPDGDNNQAFVALRRTSTALWACFSGMQYIEGLTPGKAGLRVDANNSRDALAQTDDYGFFVGEDGSPWSVAGDGAGGFSNPGPDGLLAQVSVENETWSAELYIPSSLFGGWNHPVGLEFEADYNGGISTESEVLAPPRADFPWPYASLVNAPDTWAWTILGTPPTITDLSPEKVTAGGVEFTLTVDGENFKDGSTVNWNVSALATTYISSTQVTAVVGADRIATSKYVLITITNPDLIVSDPVIFTVENPAPSISSLSPDQRNAHSSSFTLTVNGSDFVDGGEIIWNGEELTTIFVNAAQLQATISAELLGSAREVGVVVQNPEPAGGTSNIMTFSITENRFFLPAVLR